METARPGPAGRLHPRSLKQGAESQLQRWGRMRLWNRHHRQRENEDVDDPRTEPSEQLVAPASLILFEFRIPSFALEGLA